MKIIVFSTLLIVLSFNSVGQKNLQSKTSVEIFQEMYKVYEDKKFEEAIVLMKKISVNDTNYIAAQRQLSQCYLSTEQYQEAVETLEDILDYQSAFEDRASIYSSLGFAYTKLGKIDRALEILNKGIIEYPKSQYLYYAKATAYEANNDFQSALDNFKLAVQANIGYHGAHLQLGLYAAREGNYTEALLSFMTCILIDSNGEQANSIVSEMENIANGSYDPEPKNIILSKTGDDFEDLNLLIVNKIALQAKYKTKFTIPTSYAEQLHLILATIKYDKDDEGFWNQTYVQMFKDIDNKNLLDAMILFSLRSVQNEDIQKKVSSKKSVLEKFVASAGTIWAENMQRQYIDFEGKKQHVYVISNNGSNLVGKINDKTGKMYGNWYSYYEQGNLQFETELNNEGEKHGTFKEYDVFTRNLIQQAEYKNNKKSGENRTYYTSGELEQVLMYKEGIAYDTLFNYYRGGQLSDKISVKNDQRSGLTTEFYKNGIIKGTGNYKEGLPDGVFKTYHPNNKLDTEMTITNGVLNGTKKTHYSDGQLQAEVNFINDLEDGPFKSYYPNGQLEEEGMMSKGKNVGQKKQYYSNGLISAIAQYDENGKENGSIEKFDSEGKKYITFTFKKGDLEKIELFDKSGATIKTINKSGKKIKYENYYPTRTLNIEGEYNDGIASGVWKYYDNYGVLEKIEKYKNGRLQDSVIGYHPNGKIRFISEYKDGSENGIYLSYNQFGILKQEGRYLEDNPVNDWYTYYPDGSLEEEYAFKNGQRHGYQNNYAPNGKLTSYDIFSNGIIISSVYLDTNGAERARFGQMNGEIKLTDHTNSFVRFFGNYNSGTIEGNTKWYNPNNVLITEGNNVDGEREGLWKYYDQDGSLLKSIEYQSDQFHGNYITFYKNGKLKQEANYKYGDAQGLITNYYDNGNKESEITYLDDEKHGKMITYGYDGSVQQYRYYDRGVLLSYSYLDKTGKEIQPVPVSKEETTFSVYYQNGNKAVNQSRVQGLIHGEYKEYYPNGIMQLDSRYYYGDLTGPYTSYFPSGKKKVECNYLNDELEGVFTEYHANGNVKETITYRVGLMHGENKVYSETGKLIKTYLFYDGEMVKVY